MAESELIDSNPEILGGVPVFRGTRVPIKSLFDHLEAGDSIDDFLEGFPSVRREQVIALLDVSQNFLHSKSKNSSFENPACFTID